MGEAAAASLETKLIHEVLELLPVLAPLDGLHLGADEPHARAFEQSRLVGRESQIQRRLAAHRGQDGIGLFCFDHLLQHRECQRFHVGGIRATGIRHDARGVGIQQDRADTLLA